jgi:excisionase family DNA binding protein
MDEIAVSIKSAAKAIGIGRTSIYRLINEGRLTTVKLGRRTLIKAESLRRLIEES